MKMSLWIAVVLLHLVAALLGERPHSSVRVSLARLEQKSAPPPAQRDAQIVRWIRLVGPAP